MTPLLRSAGVTSKSSRASSWFCKVGKVFNNFSAFIWRKVPPSFLKIVFNFEYFLAKLLKLTRAHFYNPRNEARKLSIDRLDVVKQSVNSYSNKKKQNWT